MSVYVIADLHLSTLDSTNKSMEVFGHRWQNYITRIKNAWSHLVSEDDTVIVPGDVSWALSLDESLSDMRFIDSLPGKKILGKGNHDFWWATAAKMTAFQKTNGLDSISFLHNNALLADGCVIAGTRGWFQEDDTAHGDAEKLIRREAMRLDLSLSDAERLKAESGCERILVFLHFPPVWNGQICRPLIDALHAHGVTDCYFGHIHGVYTVPSSFEFEGIRMTILSADYLEFLPKRLF